MVKFSLPGFVLAAALLASAASAQAATNEVIIKADQAKIIRVTGQPGTVVVGNPNIADVSVQGEQVVLMGRHFGTTNVIILDRQGNQLAALDVTVQITDNNALHMYKAGARWSWACAPVCEQTLQVGDDYGKVFEPLSKSIQIKGDQANGSTKAAE